jgi:hypothetical protein
MDLATKEKIFSPKDEDEQAERNSLVIKNHCRSFGPILIFYTCLKGREGKEYRSGRNQKADQDRAYLERADDSMLQTHSIQGASIDREIQEQRMQDESEDHG